MAEVLFKEALSKRGLSDDWVVASAATWGPSGHPTTIEARTIAAEHDLDLENHGSQRVDDLDMEAYDLILVMEANHQEALRVEFPDLSNRIHLLSSMSGPSSDVRDPYGTDLEAYGRTWDEIAGLIEGGFGKIAELTADS
jgi:protein-tyrosine phosphatase